MFLTATEDARIDSRVATFALIAIFSFALGILISLIIADKPQASTQPTPCPAHCPRLILMSTQTLPSPNTANVPCPPAEPTAGFEPSSVSAAP